MSGGGFIAAAWHAAFTVVGTGLPASRAAYLRAVSFLLVAPFLNVGFDGVEAKTYQAFSNCRRASSKVSQVCLIPPGLLPG